VEYRVMNPSGGDGPNRPLNIVQCRIAAPVRTPPNRAISVDPARPSAYFPWRQTQPQTAMKTNTGRHTHEPQGSGG
jgi:hypothetical protein